MSNKDNKSPAINHINKNSLEDSPNNIINEKINQVIIAKFNELITPESFNKILENVLKKNIMKN